MGERQKDVKRVFATYDDIFKKRAASYQKAMEDAPHARDAEFRLLIDAAAPGYDDILCDIPAGGAYLRPYLADGLSYIGIETTQEFAAFCHAGPRDLIIRSAITSLSVRAASIDIVVSLAGLHHLPDRPAFFNEVFRILKPGGRFVLMDVEEGTPSDRFLNGFINEANSMGHKGEFLNAQTRTDIEAAGFHVTLDHVPDCPWRFCSDSEMVGFASDLFGIDQASPASVLDAISSILGTREESGRIEMGWSLRRILATKPA